MPRAKSVLDRLLQAPSWTWVAAALFLRLFFVLKLGSRFYQIDELGFDTPAWNLALHGVIGDKNTPHIAPPVPVALFASIYAVFGHDMLYPRLIQALLGTATSWCVGAMTRELTGSAPAGRLALAIAGIYPFFVYYNGMLISETLYLFFLVPGLWWSCGWSAAAFWRPAACGLCLALAGLCRVEAVPITLLIWTGMIFSCAAGRRRWKDLLLALLCWSLPLGAWAERNRIQTGHRVLDNHGGMSFLHGTVVFDIDQEKGTAAAMEALKNMPFYAESLALSPAHRDRAYFREAWNFMCRNPGTTLRQWARKFVNFWRFYPRTDSVYYESRHSKPTAGLSRGVLVAISLLFEPWLILGGLAGLWTLRSRWTELFPLLLFVLGTMGVHILIVSMMRYRLPVMPVLMLGFCQLASLKISQSPKR